MSSAMSSVMSSDVMSSEVRDSCASDDMEMEEAASEAPLKAHMPCAAPVESIKVFLRVRPLSAGFPRTLPTGGLQRSEREAARVCVWDERTVWRGRNGR